jgi:hypothetical protein
MNLINIFLKPTTLFEGNNIDFVTYTELSHKQERLKTTCCFCKYCKMQMANLLFKVL